MEDFYRTSIPDDDTPSAGSLNKPTADDSQSEQTKELVATTTPDSTNTAMHIILLVSCMAICVAVIALIAAIA
jgi:hypothetical protein